MSLPRTQQQLLLDLLNVPTAPFREQLVRAFCEQQLQRWKVPCCRDEHGNLIVGVNSLRAYQRILNRRSKEPVRVFVAHMDHPGFHVEGINSDGSLDITWFGGSPTRHLKDARMWLADENGYIGHGKLQNTQLHKQGYCITCAEVKPDSRTAKRITDPQQLYGGFGFRKPVWISGQRIYTKCADDLVGVFAILQTARKVFRKKPLRDPAFIGLLTRAEEVGFVGMIAHLESEMLTTATRDVLVVSLEASRTLPNAEIGKGPIVRLGDRRSNFSPDGMQLLSDLAQRTLKDRFQRRIMDGGACEATAATAFGLTTIGITVPLGNYHNEGYEGGADCRHYRGPAPEFVNPEDVAGMVKLCQALMSRGLAWDDAWRGVRERLQRNRRQYQKYL